MEASPASSRCVYFSTLPLVSAPDYAEMELVLARATTSKKHPKQVCPWPPNNPTQIAAVLVSWEVRPRKSETAAIHDIVITVPLAAHLVDSCLIAAFEFSHL